MPRKSDNTQPTPEELVTRLKHPDQAVRLHAAAALGQMGRKARKAVPALAEALQDVDAHVRRMAALALGDVGPEAAAAVPALVEALNDSHAAVRRRAVVALGRPGSAAPKAAAHSTGLPGGMPSVARLSV
jgi:HEAT repeat protein